MWFNKKHINTKLKPILLDDIIGYVLPHAGTKYTGNIISHTMQFRPKKNPENVLILYLPAFKKENIIISKEEVYFHEYYVPMMSLKQYYPQSNYYGYNVIHEQINLNTEKHNKIPKHLNTSNTLFVLSVDFSHNINMQEAIKLENTSAHALFFKQYLQSSNNSLVDNDKNTLSIVDDIRTFQFFDQYINLLNKTSVSTTYLLHWIGRTRSISITSNEGVGYLSFLIRSNKAELKQSREPTGLFITSYDKDMIPHECLGEYSWTPEIEASLLEKVSNNGKTFSRLTGGIHKNKEQVYFDIQYLYPVKTKKFIRGWHGIKYHAFYLPSVFLENTYENGNWISPNDNTWQTYSNFNLQPTLKHLQRKAGIHINNTKTNNTKTNKTKTNITKTNNTKKTKKRENKLQNYQLYEISHKMHYLR